MATYILADKSETFKKLTKAIRDQINIIDPTLKITDENTWYTLVKSQHEGKSGQVGYQLGYKHKGEDICTAVIFALDKLRYHYLPNFDDDFCEKLLDLMAGGDLTVHKGRPVTLASAESQALFNAEIARVRD